VHVLTGSSCPHPFISAACPLCRGADAPGRTAALATADAVVAAIEAAQGEAEIVLRDGDLLTRPEALDLLQHARKSTKSLELWTSGLMLTRPGVAEAVLRAGVTTLALPLYGDSAEAHDWVTGQPGHFQRVIAGLKRFRALGGKTAVIAPILRPTFRALPLLVQKSIALDVAAFRFVVLPGPDRVAQPLLPSLEMAAPYVRQALQMTAAAKRRGSVLDVPACLLGDRAVDAAKEDNAQAVAEGAVAIEHTFGPPCETCTWRGPCLGQASATAERFGWVGLATRSDPPPRAAQPTANALK
jgi:hypothetical protein